MDVEKILERLKLYFEVKTDKKLAEKLGLAPNTVTSWKRRSKIDFKLIIEYVKNIDYHWLITGELYVNQSFIKIKDFLHIQSQGTKLPVVLIPEKAQAGYSLGFSDDSVSELPVLPWMHYQDGNRYRCFEVAGDSMVPTLYPGDYLLCEKLESSREIKEGEIYVLHIGEGLLCKKVELSDHEITLLSENKNYTNKTIRKEAIREIWKAIWIHRKIQ